jgi:5-methylthioadenosine/S-adenosylhomocysteine deaminase
MGGPPSLGYFIEIKSRTWSRRDAERKAELAADLLVQLGISSAGIMVKDYVELLSGK